MTMTPAPEERVRVLEQLLAEVLERDGGNACNCINHSRKADREYEAGTCPHQRATAALQQGAAK